MATNLDQHQVIKKVYNEAEEALNVSLPADTNISLDSAEDSIASHVVTTVSSVDLTPASVPGPIPSTELVSSGNRVSFYVQETGGANLTTGQVALEVSPVAAGDVWAVLTSSNYSLPASANSTSMATITAPYAAKRIRIRLNTAPSSNCTVYLVEGRS